MARGQGTVVVRVIGEVKDLLGKLKLGETGVGQFASSSRNLIRKSFDDITSTITSRFGRIGAEAQKALDGIANKATTSGNAIGLGVGAGVAVAAAGFADLAIKGVRAFVDLAGQVRAFKRLSGESAETSSRWVAVTKLLGIEQGTVARGLAMLNKNVNTHSDALKKNGVAIARNADGSTNLLETLLSVSDAYKRAGGGAAGLTIAQEAFGSRMATQLLPLLAAGRDRIEEFWNSAEQHGELLNDADLERARKFQVSLRELESAVKGLEMAAGEGLVPVLTDTAHGITALIDAANKALRPLGGLGNAIQHIVGSLLGGGIPTFDLFKKKNKDVADSADEAADGIDDLSGSLDDSIDSYQAAADEAEKYGTALDRLRDDIFGISDAQEAVNRDFEDLSTQADDFAEKRSNAQRRLADATETSNRRIRDAEEALADARQKLLEASGGQSEDAAAFMRRYLTGDTGLGDEATQAARQVRDAEERLNDARKDGAEAINDAKKNLDDLVKKEGEARRAAREQRDELEKIPADIKTVVTEMEKQKVPASQILAYIDLQLSRLQSIKGVLGENKTILDQTVELLKQYQAFVLWTTAQAENAKTIEQRAADTVARSKDIANKITSGITINMTVNGVEDPEAAATIAAQKTAWALSGSR